MTRLGITPRHCSANSPGEAIPATVRRCAAWPATIPWHCATHSHTADAPHPRKRMAESSKGRRKTTPRPHKDNAVTSGRRDKSPPSPSVLCDHLRHPQHHPGHCIIIPNIVGGTGRQDATTQAAVRPVASRQPHPRANVRTTTKRATPTPPPSKPFVDRYRAHHDAPPDTRFARTAFYSVALYAMLSHVDEIVRHACKLPPPWPIKGGPVP
jgi:hypothetical protein